MDTQDVKRLRKNISRSLQATQQLCKAANELDTDSSRPLPNMGSPLPLPSDETLERARSAQTRILQWLSKTFYLNFI